MKNIVKATLFMLLGTFLSGGQQIAGDPKVGDNSFGNTNRCLIEAFNSVQIPNAVVESKIRDDGTEIHRRQATETYEGGRVSITSYAEIDSPDRKVSFSVYHDGTKSMAVADATGARLILEFRGPSMKKRNGQIHIGSTRAFSTPHGEWTVAAVETMENTFTKCMGLPNSHLRSDSAATSVSLPPPHPPAPVM